MTIPYTQNIPDDTHNPSVDQPDMETNTNSIAQILDVDMIGFAQANGGRHKKVTYQVQGAAPACIAGQYIEYSKAVLGGGTELFAIKDALAAVQMTRGLAGAAGAGFYSFLPGGFLIQWGTAAFVAGGAPITFPVPFTANPFVTATCNTSNASFGASIVIVDNTKMKVYMNGPTASWIAIGT